LGEADKEYNSIVSLVKEVESIAQKYQVPGGLENPYTTLTASVSFSHICFTILFETLSNARCAVKGRSAGSIRGIQLISYSG
jgi:hypothetical protein